MKRELLKLGLIFTSLFLGSLFSISGLNAQSIATKNIPGSPFCSGTSVSVQYIVSGSFSPSNVFIAQLSNAIGSFVSPVTIGTLASSNSGTIPATIPENTLTGTGYRIRVVSSNPNVIGTDNGADLMIQTSPVINAITTTTLSEVSFSVTPVDGVDGIVPPGTTYSWPEPVVTGGMTGGMASSGPSSNISGTLINLTTIPRTATYTITPTSGNCIGSEFTLTVTVNPITNLYSYQTGNWDNPSTWTTDPSGNLQIGTSLPGDNDVVTILSGRTVTLQNDINLKDLKVVIKAGGFLNQDVHEFMNSMESLSGEGTLQLASANFPNALNNSFIKAGGGTTEYNNAADFTLPIAQNTYNNLTINTPEVVATQLSNLVMNGDLTVKNGTFQINDNVSSVKRTLTIHGNVSVEEGAFLTVGKGVTNGSIGGEGGVAPFLNYYLNFHTVIVEGDFTNHGSVKFTNLLYPVYNAFPPTSVSSTSGAASVYFQGANNNTLTCNGPTIFYNLIVDKGVDRTYKLTINSTDYENFKLFGANRLSALWPLTSNPDQRKALWIHAGTLVLKGSLIIPSLSEGTGGNAHYYIPFKGALVIDGADVVVLSTADNYQEVNAAYSVAAPSNSAIGVTQGGPSALYVFGKFQMNKGFLSTKESGGIITAGGSGQIFVNGGTLDTKQFLSSSGSAAYNQSGGLFILRGRFRRTPADYSTISNLTNVSMATLNTARANNGINAGFGTFNLENANNIFTHSGGTICIYDVCGTNANQQEAFDVKSSESNINVTGGTVEFKPVTGTNLIDAANFYITTTAPLFNVVVDRISSSSEVGLKINPLIAQNNFIIASGSFSTNDLDLSIGGNFYLESGISFDPGNNTTLLNGTGNQILTVNLSSPLSFNKLTINKPSGKKVDLAGSQNILNINNEFRLVDGTLKDNGKTINIAGQVFNSGIHEGTGAIVLNGTVEQSIDGNGVFQNLELNNTNAAAAPVSLVDNTTINGVLTFSQDKIFNIGIYNLTLNASASISNAGVARFIQTAGNAGDGGVTKVYNAMDAFTFPVGAPTLTPALPVKYTPATIGFNSTPAEYGSVTVNPVGYEHPSTTIDGQSLTYFWRVRSSGFSGIAPNSVSHSFIYHQSDVVGNEANYIPALYTSNDFTWRFGTNSNPPINITNNIISDWTTPSNSTNFLDGDYTAGDAAFGNPTVYYSRQGGWWGNTATWSLTGHTVDNPPTVPPSQNDVVIIGGQDSVYLATNNTVPNTDVRNCASLMIESGSALDIGYNFASDFGIVLSHPNGNGNFRLTTSWTSESTFTFPQGDFSDYNVNVGTTELYSTNPTAGTTYWLPNGISSYGNLILSPLGGSNIIFANNDLTIYGSLITRGQNADSWFLPTWNVNYPTPPSVPVPKTITIIGDLHIQGGALMWYGNGNVTQDFVVYGDVIVETLAALFVWSGAYSQSMAIGGSLINNTDGLNHGLTTTSKVDFSNIPVTFFGSSDASISNTTGNPLTVFGSLTIDKGNSAATTLTCDIGGTLNTPANNWLTLVNGTFRYMRTNPGTNFTISTNSAFTIPSTAGLTINYTNANNRRILIGNANNNNADLLLGGKLTIINGDVYVGPIAAPGNNNDIEYSGGGASAIGVLGGNLTVNGQIRRNILTTNGILEYTQTGGTVRINGNAANNDYAKLEVLNEESVFNMSGGTLTIVRGGGTAYGDLYIRPDNSSVTGGTIIFSNATPNTIQNYSLDANAPLNNLTLSGANGAGVNANLDLLISPLVLNGTLTLNNAQSILNTNGIDLTVKGNFQNNGTYNFGTNTTTFNGGQQEITGSSVTEFYNLTISSTNSLTVNNNFSVAGDMAILSGNLILENNQIVLSGDLTNNGAYTDDNISGGIRFAGTTQQQISGTGSFGRIEIDNIFGVKLNSGILVQNDVFFVEGILDINSHLLTLSQNSSISGSTDITRMIMSEGVLNSQGVRKFFSASPQTFTFPVGVLGKYTPMELTISASATVGYVNISPINEFHPTAIDSLNVLNYYWKIESAGISDFEGSFLLKYNGSDVTGDESSYVAAHLEVPGNIWSTAPPGPATDNVDEINHEIIFYFTESNNLSGDFTAGGSDEFPLEINTYESNADGNWTNPDNWTAVGNSPPCPDGGPSGANVIINHVITVDVNNISALNTTLNNKLRILSPTFGHSLGDIEGNGTIYLENGNIPAGEYSSFLDCLGNGTLEFGGSSTYTIIADQFSSLPNLFFTGSGTRILPNKDLTICNRLVIDGPTLDNSVNNYKLTILGTMERYNSGAFISGTGEAPAATVSFSGDAIQNLGGPTGDFTGTNKFNNLEINNEQGLEISLNGTVEVNNQLLLTNGTIHTSSTNSLILLNNSPSAILPFGGSSNSFIDGPLIKRIINGEDFLFPLGKGTTKGHNLVLTSTAGTTLFWTAEYFTPNPTSISLASPLQAANTKEYWSISTGVAANALINLAWDRRSDLIPLMLPNGLDDMRVAEFNTGAWNELVSSATGNDYNGNVVTTTNVAISTTSKDFTLASVEETTARAYFAEDGPVCGESGIAVEFANYDPIGLNFTLDYTIDGNTQPSIEISSLPFYLPTPVSGVYKLTNFIFNNGANTGVVDTTSVTVYDSPLTADAGEDQSLCGVSGAILEGNDPGIFSGVWTILSGSGGILLDNTLNTTVFTGVLGETYTLRWTISNAACSSSDEVIISFPIIAAIPSHFTSAVTPVCQGSFENVYTVPNVAGVTYNWSYSGTGQTINGSGNSVSINFDLSATSGTLSVTATNSCGTSPARTLDIVVNSLPVATFSYENSPYCFNAPNPLPTFSGGGTAGIFSSTAGLVFVNNATGEIDLAGSTPGTYVVTNTIYPSGGCGLVSATSTVSIITDLVWTGDINTDWNTPQNWSCGIIPELTTVVQIPDVPNQPVLNGGAIGSVKDITIEEGSSLTVAGNTLRISGVVTTNGSFNALSGVIEMMGSSTQIINTDLFLNNTIDGLIINNASGVVLQGNLNVTGIVSATTGNLAADGFLTLVSNAAGTALVDGSGDGEIIGDVVMQRYLPSRFGYKYFSSPFQAATVNEFSDETDLSASFPTFYDYDEDKNSSGWIAYTNPSDVLDPMAGYAINFGPEETPITVDVKGVVNNSPQTRIVYNNNRPYTQGFNLAGNPYPSPIDWDAASGWTKTNIDNALYYFKAGGADQYSGSYSSYINGISSDGLATNIIPSMQGFFVHVSDGAYPVTGELGMNNLVRIDDQTHPFLKTEEHSDRIFIRFTASYADNPGSSDPMVIYFDDYATDDFDREYDALKLINTDLDRTNFYSLLPGDVKLSINALNEIIDPVTTIPVGLITHFDGDVSFRIKEHENLMQGMKIYLHDAAAGINTNLLEEQEYNTYLEAGEHPHRFSIRVVDGNTVLPENDPNDLFNLYCSKGQLHLDVGYIKGNEAVFYLFDLSGRKVAGFKVKGMAHYNWDPRINDGIYIAKLLTGNSLKTKKILIE